MMKLGTNYIIEIESHDSSEIELFNGSVIIGRGALVDCVEYKHDLPNKQK